MGQVRKFMTQSGGSVSHAGLQAIGKHGRPARCAEFERACQLAAADEELSLIWQRLFDDANP